MARSNESPENEHMLEMAMQAQRRQIEFGHMMTTMLNNMKNENKKVEKGGIRTKNIEVPTFEGESHSYQEWRKQASVVIKNLDIAESLKGLYLFRALKGKARDYVGTQDWSNKEDQLWQKLDERYADGWNVEKNLVEQGLKNEMPEESIEQIGYADRVLIGGNVRNKFC